jgi:hypothetical protein
MDLGFQKRKRREKLYNKLHKSFVNTCMGVTLASSIYIGYKLYEYFRYIRPLQLAQTKLTQDELLLEGRYLQDSPKAELST